MGKTFRLEGVDELNRVFKKLPKKLRQSAVLNATRAGARVIRDEAKRLAPKDTGALRKGIKVITPKKAARTSERLVTVGVKGDAAFRAHFTEFGTGGGVIGSGPRKGQVIPPQSAQPFLRPAVTNKGREAIRIIAESLGDQVGVQAAKLIASEGANKKR